MSAIQNESGPNPAVPEPSAGKDDRFKEFVEFLPQPVFEVDTLGNILFANRQGLRVFGYDREDLLQGINALELLAPEDRERAKKNIERTQRGEDLGGTEYQALKKDGGRFPILIYSTTVYHQGKPSGLRGIVLDISARKKAEEDLKASEERYRQVVELSNDAITIVRGKTHLYVNPKMVEIFGYSHADEIVGRPITQLIHPDDRERVAEFNRRRQEGGGSLQI